MAEVLQWLDKPGMQGFHLSQSQQNCKKNKVLKKYNNLANSTSKTKCLFWSSQNNKIETDKIIQSRWKLTSYFRGYTFYSPYRNNLINTYLSHSASADWCWGFFSSRLKFIRAILSASCLRIANSFSLASSSIVFGLKRQTFNKI